MKAEQKRLKEIYL